MSDKPKKFFLDSALEHIPGGFLIYRADNKDEEILYANQALIHMFDCDTYEEFLQHVHGSFKGLVSPEDLDVIEKEIDVQIQSGFDSFDHIYYHVTTKSGDIKYIEDFGHYVIDKEEGPLYYVYLVDSDQKLLTFDVDKVTGLPGPRRLRDYSHKMIRIINKSFDSSSYAYVYLNIVHFKRFIIRYGIKSGDDLLKDVSSILKREFAGNMIARMGDTVFAIFAETNRIEDKVKELNKRLRKEYKYKDVLLKAGVYVIGSEDMNNLDGALDNARRACHELDYSDEILYKIYDDEMKKNQLIYNYIIHHLDEAIEKKWIQAYYQPVIRTLSGTLCSAEALVRWIDPQYGVISPVNIIPALEDTRQIHRIDEYVLNEICKLIRDRISKGLGVIPISFNLSRLDFMLMDVYKVIVDTCKKYEIPHSALKIEITESLVVEDTEGVIEVANKLRKEGFEIWMDDFGMGYSSLGTLKDFDFDEIKFDMSFMKNFSFRSQQIVKHVVSLCKSLGIQTLAEGVETEEHLAFLKSIGCEKAQGYLFSKPLPFNDMLELLELRGIQMEASRYSHFYNEISRIDFTENLPMCIVNYYKNRSQFETLFLNNALKDVLAYINVKSNKDLEVMLNSSSSLFAKKVKASAYLPEDVGVEKTFFYTYNGNYIRFQARNIATLDDHYMYVIYINNLTTEEQRITQGRLEKTISHIYGIYDEIYTLNFKKDTLEPISNFTSNNNQMFYHGKPLSELLEYVRNELVYIEDRKFFDDFFNKDDIEERLIQGKASYVVHPMRFYEQTGEIVWKMLFLLQISSPEEGDYLCLTRKLLREEVEGIMSLKGLNSILAMPITSQDLWENATHYSDIKFFWKDKQGKYLGCSQAFLDTIGLSHKNEVIGKTEKEIHWNVNAEEYIKDEEEVLTKGKIIRSLPGVRIIKGVPHNIATTIIPLYREGKIIGTIGHFIDLDDKSQQKAYEDGMIDTQTDVLNSRGFLDSLLRYINESRRLNVPFSAITIRVRNIEEIKALQGLDVVLNIEKEIAKVLKTNYGLDSSISHIGFGSFAIIRSFLNENNSVIFRDSLVSTIEAIKNVNNVPVTLFVDTVAVNSEEAQNSPEGFNKLFLARFTEISKK
ncbi:EAL domain-containing protein [Treponema rectale]|uniref:EAL domain-containing protein n=1 Tax=Treponema rectale TaxID=744512 RepID=A0A7M1XJN8_9SPIR|nr:EAL domain-containing protein [Treponema rectale]